jgi:hypothetical protein
LLSLYAQQADERALLQFLHKPETLDAVDLKYALRLCTKYDKTQACVLIYSALSLFEEAVDLALRVDIGLAKETADKPADDDELRKKLWLRIARHVVEKERDIQTAMSFLNSCDLLKIEGTEINVKGRGERFCDMLCFHISLLFFFLLTKLFFT